MLLTTLLALAPFAAAQHPIDATLDPSFSPSPFANGGGFGAQSTSGFDDFNRSDSGDLGPDWTTVAGAIGITNNRAQGIVNLSMATINGVDDDYASSTMSAVVDNGNAGLSYVALVAGYADTANNVFVKLQDNNSDSLMDRVFFYYGNNGGTWGASVYYYDLATPTPTATIHLSFDSNGDRAVFTVENDSSGQTEVFYGDNLLGVAANLGTGFGLGTYGIGSADDYTVNDGAAQMRLDATGKPRTSMTFTATGATPGSGIAMIYAFGMGSYIIPNGLPCAGTMLGLARPEGWVIVTADASGTASHTQLVPGAAAGLVYVQALDLATCGLSQVLAL
ncbi:MAG: hypothetical protein MK209_01155 [Planctomycetes bacterium]|nr:hypothetical protein [Planctomycetota bacterium]